MSPGSGRWLALLAAFFCSSAAAPAAAQTLVSHTFDPNAQFETVTTPPRKKGERSRLEFTGRIHTDAYFFYGDPSKPVPAYDCDPFFCSYSDPTTLPPDV